ncbi:VOC family protein [Microbacterium caowuchunii]|uniref:VOC family protein n=1 Tax=Microbacterium caowuchunii TaxID=2614638 RepID=UPI001246AF4E|nr:VOC family protein [Microbacterium caowuchunii]QEW00103.1 VOC family protein [Microbacterium caowuchunii]
MSAPVPYLHFDGKASDALRFYQSVFGGELVLHTRAEFGQGDASATAIAHGILSGPVDLFGADTSGDERPVRAEGLTLSLLGFPAPSVLREWFSALSVGGDVLDPLQERPWGDWDGTVRDRFGLTWLIGYGGESDA